MKTHPGINAEWNLGCPLYVAYVNEYGSQGEMYVSMLGNSVGSECIEQNYSEFKFKTRQRSIHRALCLCFYRLKDGLEVYFSHSFFCLTDQISKKSKKTSKP